MKASCKRLKVFLMLRVKKLGPFFLVSKLDKFLLFDNFFPDLVNFWDLDRFWPFNFLDFLVSFILLPSLTLNITTLLLLFSTLGLNILGDPAIFNIEISGATILLKL